MASARIGDIRLMLNWPGRRPGITECIMAQSQTDNLSKGEMLNHKIYHKGVLAKAAGLINRQNLGEHDWVLGLHPLAKSECASPKKYWPL